MVNLTIRNIPEEILKRIRILAIKNRRSMNSEILIIIEEGFKQRLADIVANGTNHSYDGGLSVSAREQIWDDLSGQWKDGKPFQDLVDEVYELRNSGGVL